MRRDDALVWGRGDTRRRRAYPAAVLSLVREKFGGHKRCEACYAAGRTPPKDEPLQVDHIQPLSKGGDNHFSNLRWLCRGCNLGRGNRGIDPNPPRWWRTRER